MNQGGVSFCGASDTCDVAAIAMQIHWPQLIALNDQVSSPSAADNEEPGCDVIAVSPATP